MLKNFLKLAFRNILKNKIFTLINLSNLVIGYTTFILFSCFIYNELNWDKHNKNYDRIFRVQLKINLTDGAEYNHYSPSALAYHVLDTVSGIENSSLINELNDLKGLFLSVEGGEQINEKKGYASESSIFDIFTYEFIEGTPARALDEPNEIVLSETMAKKLFRTENALGNTVLIDKKIATKVTGVYKDLPENSHFRPAYYLSISTFKTLKSWDYENDWWDNICFNYVLLYPGVDPINIGDRLDSTFKSFNDREYYKPYLHPLSKLYLSSNGKNDFYILLSVLSLAAMLLLVLSSINFINLNIANATTRAREIGIKKVVGSSRKSIIIQFLTESFFISIIAVFMGILLTQLIMPYFKLIINRNLDIHLWNNPNLLIFLISSSLVTGLLAGLYPAFVMSSFNPVKVLKGNFYSAKPKGISLKKVLVTAQFSISLYILLTSLIVYRQLNFMTHKDMGFNKDNLLYTNLITFDYVSYTSLREHLLKFPEIEDFSYSKTIPFEGNIGGYYNFEGGFKDQKVSTSRNYVSYDFLTTYGLKLTEGRNFSREASSDKDACIINETAARAFGWNDDPVGKKMADDRFTVIGVVKDFHPYTSHMEIPPYFMLLYPDSVGSGLYTLRYKPGNRDQAKRVIESEFASFFPRDPFEFKDFDNTIIYDNAVVIWRSIGRLTAVYAVLALSIASMGLFGLILFTAKRRTKEIGVRKVFGGSIKSIFSLMTFEIVKLIFIAVIISWPAAMYFYDKLPGAYKYHLQVWEFLYALLILIVVALLTISFQILRAARVNPVNALRYE